VCMYVCARACVSVVCVHAIVCACEGLSVLVCVHVYVCVCVRERECVC